MSTEELLSREDVRDGFTEIPEGTPPWKRRLLMRQILIERGTNPVTTLPIHEQAPNDASGKDRFPRPYTCGSCTHRCVVTLYAKVTGSPRNYPKCDLLTKERMAARTGTTDTPRWMPACVAYSPTEGMKWQ